MPVGNRQLAGDDGGAPLAAVLDHLEQVSGLGWGEWPEGQIVDASPVDQQPGPAAVDMGNGETVEHSGRPQVEGAWPWRTAAWAKAQARKLFPAPVGPDQQVLVGLDPLRRRQ